MHKITQAGAQAQSHSCEKSIRIRLYVIESLTTITTSRACTPHSDEPYTTLQSARHNALESLLGLVEVEAVGN